MKKNLLIFLLASLFVLLLSCNKDEKFPTKIDLKGHWTHSEGFNLADELIFDYKSVKLIFRYGDTVYSKTCNYRLDIAIKKIYFTSGVLEGNFYDIWIDKKTGLLYLKNFSDFQLYNNLQTIFKKNKV